MKFTRILILIGIFTIINLTMASIAIPPKHLISKKVEANEVFRAKTPWSVTSGGEIIYLDRHSVNCKNGAMSWFRLFRENVGNGGTDRIQYKASCLKSKALKLKSFENKHTNFNITEEHNRSVNYLDRHHVKCDEGTVLQQFKLQRNSKGDKIRYDYRCVKANIICCSDDTSKLQKMGERNVFYLDRQSTGVENSDDRVLQSFRLLSNYNPDKIYYQFRMCKLRDEDAFQQSVILKKEIVQNIQFINLEQAKLNTLESEIVAIKKRLEETEKKYAVQQSKLSHERTKFITLKNKLNIVKQSKGLTC